VIVASVIIGGIKRIGQVASRIVPFMCGLYLLAGAYVLLMNLGELPSMLALIVRHGLPSWLGGEPASASGAFLGGSFGYAAMWGIKRALFSSESGQGSAPIAHAAARTREPVSEGVVAGLEPFIDTLVVCTFTALVILSSGAWNRGSEAAFASPSDLSFSAVASPDSGGPQWLLSTPPLPAKNSDAKRILRIESGPGWRSGEKVFLLVEADANANTGGITHRVSGTVRGTVESGYTVEWQSLIASQQPRVARAKDGSAELGIFGDYAAASLTAHAFDRSVPGLGMWLVTLSSWLFALSTMISWSYYGEQGVVYLAGERDGAILSYKLIYCLLIVVSTLGFITTDHELDMWTTLGLGVMLVVNIPIMLIFGPQAMRAYHEYMGKLKRGEL
jgi:AGCS family alanine or glycine:cation symporter